MPTRKSVSKTTIVKLAADAIAGLTKRELMNKYPAVSERVIRLLMQNDVGVDEWRAALAKELQSTVGEILLEIRKAVRDGKISPNSLPIALGILLDKSAAIETRSVVSVPVNVQINSYGSNLPKESWIAMLRGDRNALGLLPAGGDTTESIAAGLDSNSAN